MNHLLQDFTNYLILRRRSTLTIKLYVGHVRRLMVAQGDPLTLSMLDLERYMAAHPHWAPRTTNSFVCGIHAFYRWALRYKLIAVDPSVEIETVKVPDEPARMADDESIESALAAARSTEERAMVVLARSLGLRRAEVARLHTSDRHGDWLHVRGKGDRVRRLFLRPAILELLRELERSNPGGYYFPGRFGGHRSPESVYAIVTRLVQSNPHSLRHRAATAVYRGTAGDIRATQAFLGHKSIQTTMRYVHTDDEQLVRASAAAELRTAA